MILDFVTGILIILSILCVHKILDLFMISNTNFAYKCYMLRANRLLSKGYFSSPINDHLKLDGSFSDSADSVIESIYKNSVYYSNGKYFNNNGSCLIGIKYVIIDNKVWIPSDKSEFYKVVSEIDLLEYHYNRGRF